MASVTLPPDSQLAEQAAEWARDKPLEQCVAELYLRVQQLGVIVMGLAQHCQVDIATEQTPPT